ncbi:MAG: carbohydrate kinase [Gammaproteobacteria bacterium]|nr:MAG: carbohydrate kinase [Gammaproteobacteria bacterium]
MKDTVVLAIDNGTQSVRTLLINHKGDVLAKGKCEIEPYFSQKPGWAEQHVEVYWDALCTAQERMWKQAPVRPDAVKAVTVTTQRGTVVCLDKYGQPLRPAIIWLDQREATHIPRLPLIWRTAFRLAGVSGTVDRFMRRAQANWLAEHEPDIWQQTHKFVLLSGYWLHRLTGNFVDSVGSQVGYVPFDYKRLDWAAPRDWRWQALPITREQLPDLIPPCTPAGQLRPEPAQALGVRPGLPVIAAAADKACEILGSGGLEPGLAALSFGTTATINTTRKCYTEVTRFIPPYPSAVPEHFSTEVMIYRGFWMVSWFLREFGAREAQQAVDQGIPPEALFDSLIEGIPPGSMGLMLQPYWSPGIREPGPEAKGAMIGFGDVHNRAHIYRAILEGLAYSLREGRERIEKRTRMPIHTLRISGGGSQSDQAMQITANVFNCPAERPHTPETSALGAAINAMVGLGVYPDCELAARAMVRVGQRFEPEPEAVHLYERLYREVYRNLYGQLAPLYRKIRDITGYPA